MAFTSSSSFLALLESGNFSDAVVKCKDRSWKVHKAILCSRSKWFDKALNGKFEEAKTAILTITETSPEKIEWLLKYLYRGAGGAFSDGSYAAWTEVYSLGHFFDLPDLQSSALTNLKERLTKAATSFKSLRESLVEELDSDDNGSDDDGLFVPIRAQTTPSKDDIIKDFLKGVREAYGLGILAKPLQDVFVDFVRQARYSILGHHEFMAGSQDLHLFKADVLTAMCEDMVDWRMLGHDVVFPESSLCDLP
ncbi:hypothetical protein SUNI508_07358 [Seiridium unicorne]|uniref:BTB domain-containing protein n=1 Tax=Seiridium unicorne TaxID=138068 RepID=A0ABR2UY87_9PEZI